MTTSRTSRSGLGLVRARVYVIVRTYMHARVCVWLHTVCFGLLPNILEFLKYFYVVVEFVFRLVSFIKSCFVFIVGILFH